MLLTDESDLDSDPNLPSARGWLLLKHLQGIT